MLFWLGLGILCCYLLIGIELLPGSRKIPFLSSQPLLNQAELPKVSIIVAARDEERNLHAALHSLLQLDYPNLELILIDDRSGDRTGQIIDELAASDSRLSSLHIENLPDGWLGKNHALWCGSQQATGELFLFTDADVLMAPDTLQRAVALLTQNQLDHLAVTPEARMPSLLLNVFGTTFGFFFFLFTRPWRCLRKNSSSHIGIGAFNLVKQQAYQQVGGHQAIALRPDDDLKLGKLIKKSGYRQQLAYGTGLITVEWYANFRQLAIGLEKNLFAGADYRIGFTLCGIIFNLLVFSWPFVALLVTDGTTFLVYLLAVVSLLLIIADGNRLHNLPRWQALGFPLTATLFTLLVIRTLVLNLFKGGIVWRGTFYPLTELRKNRI